jgi:hypothetical protein
MWGLFQGKGYSNCEEECSYENPEKQRKAQVDEPGNLAAIRRKKRLWKTVKGKAITEEYRVVDRRVKKMIRNAKSRMEKQLADGDGSKQSL